MTEPKDRHLWSVPTTPTGDVASLQRAARVTADRHAHLAHQGQHARDAARDPEVAREIKTLVARTAYRLAQQAADVAGLLTVLATEMYAMGHVDGSDQPQPGLADATLGAILASEKTAREAGVPA